MEPKEEKMALAPQPRRAQRFRAVRADGPPERTRSRDAERILSLVNVTGLAIIDVPYQFGSKISKGAECPIRFRNKSQIVHIIVHIDFNFGTRDTLTLQS
jgi:hypothetical protein